MFGPIRQHQPTPRLHELCGTQASLTLVSDASVQKNKQSGFAWVINHGDTTIWNGVGLAPGNAEDMYSGRAEAFGMLAGLIFFSYYTSCYQKPAYQGTSLHCFCDNLGIITNVTELRQCHTPRPNDTTADDRDVYAAICDAAKSCAPIRTTFNHVKGHQDKDPNRPLTRTELLNIECDKRAKKYTTTTTTSSTALGNPMIPIAQPHLIIGNKIICRQVLTALRQAAAIPPYQKALQERYHWTPKDFRNVHWTTVQTALHNYSQEDQRRIVLFIHEKLPLRASKAHPHYGSQLCPSCQRTHEDPKHFLECTHPDRNKSFSELKNKLTLYATKLRLHPCLFTTIWLGLTSIRTDTPYPDVLNEAMPSLHSPILSQTRLGWNQLYYGRFSNAWAKAIDETHPTLATTGENVITTLIKHLWDHFLAIWKLRNEHLHHNAGQLDLPNYQQAARTLYEQKHLLSSRAQDSLYKQPLEQVLNLPPPKLQAWVVRGYKYFTQQLKAEKKQAAMGTPDIRTFFRPLTQHPDDLHPP